MKIQWKQRLSRQENIHPVLASLAVCLLAPMAYALSYYGSRNADWAEAYVRAYQVIAAPISRVIGYLPFSLAEFVLPLVVISAVVICLVRLILWRPVRAVAGLLAGASIVYAIFATGWGMAYARQPYANSAGLTMEPRSVQSLKSMSADLIREINELRAQAPEDAQGLYAVQRSERALLRDVQAAYDAAAASHPWLAGSYGAPKPVLFSKALSHLQISGIYIPFTFEANVNMNNLPYMIPAVASHEAAHLRGWAREDEANYIAYLVGRHSGDADFAYSGLLLGLIHAMNALAGADSQSYWELEATYHPGVSRDLAAYHRHWEQYEGKASELQEQVNDAYLRINRQEDGVRSYGRMVDLMLAEYIQRNGTL